MRRSEVNTKNKKKKRGRSRFCCRRKSRFQRSSVLRLRLVFFSITMKMRAEKHLLCLFLLTFPLSWAVHSSKDAKNMENDSAVWSQTKNRRLFARRKISLQKERHVPNIQMNLATPGRRCSRLMESCSGRTPCCDPCASCRCRLFNTICHCWRSNPLCLKQT